MWLTEVICVVIICFIHYSQGVLSSLQKLPTTSRLPLIVTMFIVRWRWLQMTKNENSSQITPAVKHQWRTFARKQMKVGCTVHHVTNFTDIPKNNFTHCSTLIPLAIPYWILSLSTAELCPVLWRQKLLWWRRSGRQMTSWRVVRSRWCSLSAAGHSQNHSLLLFQVWDETLIFWLPITANHGQWQF